jgi:anti-anti-sigma factor
MSLGLKIDLEEIEGRTILRIQGRIDAQSAPVLERKIDQLIGEGRLHLLLDFEHIDYLSSAGMRTLLSAAKKIKAKNGMIVLFSLSSDVEEIIRMAGFEKILSICASEREALQQLKK